MRSGGLPWIGLALWCCACVPTRPDLAELSPQAETLVTAAEEKLPEVEERPPPPRDPTIRRARARGALPPGAARVELIDAAEASPYVLAVSAFGDPRDGGGVMLGLVDVTSDPGVLLGRHDFAGGAMEIRKPIVLETGSGEPVVLADLAGPVDSVACGWWLSRTRPRFLCAPKIAGPSRHEAWRDTLVESWETDFPPDPIHAPTRTGRILRVSPAGRWAEVDSFRCLGMPVAEALERAGSRGLRRWQRDSVARLSRVALHASEGLDDARSARLLQDAIDVDACDAGSWRLLGRLEYQSGRSASATSALAAAVALDSRDAPALVDLADALLDLDAGTTEGRQAFDVSLALLARPAVTEPTTRGASGPRDLARALYELYLTETEASAVLHESRRRRVEQQLESLR